MRAEWPLVKPGAEGPRGKALQRLRVHRGADLTVDAAFGPATEKALETFQPADGLDADGIAGPHTSQLLIVGH